MPSTNKTIVIIGSGLAGYTLAMTLRRLEKKKSQPLSRLLIITADDGAFYPKPMLSTALTHNKTPDMLIAHSAKAMEEQLEATIYTRAVAAAVEADKKQVWIQGRKDSIPYTALVFACGAHPLTLPCSHAIEPSPLRTVNNLEDYKVFRNELLGKKRIAIIGAGLVGCEFANDLANVGIAVDIVAMADQPLERLLPPLLAKSLKACLSEKGVNWHLSNQVRSIEEIAGQENYRLHLMGGTTLDVDGVLSAIGLAPNVSLARSAGIAVERGIVVDRYLRTSCPSIYALGDCAEVNGVLMYFVAPLRQCAQALAQTLAGCETAVSYPPMPVLVKTPSCPIVVSPPPEHCDGKWVMEGNGHHFSALFFDKQAVLRGFALTGNCTRERARWTRELPPIFGAAAHRDS